jgi:hypothetical protein
MGLPSDMEITFMDGVNGNGIHADAIPPVRSSPIHISPSLMYTGTGTGTATRL